ncbi:MAG TPA: serine hydrolase, partial [Steroidobacteraceae bacterium]
LNESGASTAKILLFYAAHQMLFDLEEMVKAGGIKKTADLRKKANAEWAKFTCKPHFDWLFKFTESAGPLKVEMSDALNTTMANIVDEKSSTPNASRLILRLSFEYLASLAWQSGLRHPSRKGVWYGSTYCQTGGAPAPISGACHVAGGTESGCGQNQSRIIWTKDPLGHRSVRGSALSYVTYMTLLAQARLVNKGMSARIEALLKRACGFIQRVVPGMRANKCGLTNTLFHDAAIIEHDKVRYAVAYMFKSKSLADPLKGKVLDLMREIDKIIVAANP